MSYFSLDPVLAYVLLACVFLAYVFSAYVFLVTEIYFSLYLYRLCLCATGFDLWQRKLWKFLDTVFLSTLLILFYFLLKKFAVINTMLFILLPSWLLLCYHPARAVPLPVRSAVRNESAVKPETHLHPAVSLPAVIQPVSDSFQSAAIPQSNTSLEALVEALTFLENPESASGRVTAR